MNADSRIKSVKNIPFLGKFISHLEKNVEKYGLVKTSRLLITSSNTRFKIISPNETSKVLTNHPCVVSFNHPYEVETFAVLAALPNRLDIRGIATANLLSLAPKLKNHIFPVWIDHHAKKEKAGKISGKIAKFFNIRPELNPQTAHLNNIKSIKDAASFVNHDGIVTIAPAGFRGFNGSWFSGIGHLISQISNRDAYYIACYVKNTSDIWDWFRLLSPLGKLLPEIQVYFSKPITIQSIRSKYKYPKTIASELESEYKIWQQQLS